MVFPSRRAGSDQFLINNIYFDLDDLLILPYIFLACLGFIGGESPRRQNGPSHATTHSQLRFLFYSLS